MFEDVPGTPTDLGVARLSGLHQQLDRKHGRQQQFAGRALARFEVGTAEIENELRRRLLDEVLPKESVTTWLEE